MHLRYSLGLEVLNLGINYFPSMYVGLNTFVVLIFVVFVADYTHFDRIFKMVLIFTECLKWFSFL